MSTCGRAGRDAGIPGVPGISRATRAFTLIELIVVLTVITMLAALLFPVFAAVRRKARESTCLSNLRQIGLATRLYETDNDGKLPPHNPTWWSRPSYNPLAADTRLYLCPETGERSIYSDHVFRFELDNLKPPPADASADDPLRDDPDHVRTLPEPGVVLAYCFRHLAKGYSRETNGGVTTTHYESICSARREGFYLVVRESGAAQRIPAGQVKVGGYERKDGKDTWFDVAPDATLVPSTWEVFDVFPDEPWPPQFEQHHG